MYQVERPSEMMELYTERDRIAHLLRRFGLGASEAEIAFYSSKGMNGAIDALLEYSQIDEGFDLPLDHFENQKQKINIVGVQAWWVARLLMTRRPLLEKMTLFWHDHFATSAAKVAAPMLMHQQNETLRSNATGKFQDLLLEVSKDPAMLLWLDNQYNVRGKANENFAREVMELFTLGIGNYTEQDIQQSARAFTGWSLRRKPVEGGVDKKKYRTAEFVFRANLHDDGEKTFFGKTGPFNGEDIIAMLCKNPQTARYITNKVWKWFGYADPETALIERLASGFYDSGLDIKHLLKSVMLSDEFYSDRANRHVFKSPVDFVIPPMRQLGIGAQLANLIKGSEEVPPAAKQVIGVAQRALKQMGMTLLFPPDVSGWEGGAAWVTSATMVERIAFGEALYAHAQNGSQRPMVHYDAYNLLQGNGVDGAVRTLLSIYDIQLPEPKIRSIVHTAMELSQGTINEQNANEVASRVSRLIFGTPEFQMC